MAALFLGLPLAAAAATYSFSGAIGGAQYPACSGGSWSQSGNTYTCSSGSIALAAGDAILPAASIVVVAQNGGTLAGNNTLGSAAAGVSLKTDWGALSLSGGNVAIFGDLATGSGAVNIAGSNNAIHGSLTSSNWTTVTATNTVIDGNIAVSGPITLTNVTVKGAVSTNDKVVMTGGSVTGDVSASNGVTTNGTVIGGDVKLSNSGTVSLTGGSVGGTVHSDCCEVTAKNTDIGNGVSSGVNTVTIDGGTVTGPISTNGGAGIVVKNGATVTGTLTSSQPINVSNSTIYGDLASGNNVTLTNNTTVWGNVAAANWPNSLSIDGTSQVAGSCNPIHPRCGVIAMDHVRLSHSGSGVTCIGSPILVTICNSADSGNSCVTSNKAISGRIVARKNDGGEAGSVSFEIPAYAGSTTAHLLVGTAQTVTLETADLTLAGAKPTTCWNTGTGAACEHTFVDAGFVVSETETGPSVDIATQAAGAGSATYYLRAVKTNLLTKACEAALQGTNAVNFSYECTDPGTCFSSNLMSLNGGTNTVIARNDEGAVSNWASVTMEFDGDGSAPFTLNYTDAGMVKLHATKTVGTTALTGAWGFVTRPAGFALVTTCTDVTPNVVNTAVQTSGPEHAKFCPAGAKFDAVVSAVTTDGYVTPNYGREKAPHTHTVKATWSRQLPTGTGTSDGTLPASNAFVYTGDDDDFTGSFRAPDLTWSEVGILKATLGIASDDYLGIGAGATAAANSTAYVGRFYPHHFTTTAAGQTRPKLAADTDDTPRTCTGFAYSGRPSPLVLGQPFNLTATAVNAQGGTTVNYTWDNDDASNRFARDVALSFSSPAGSPAGKPYRGATVGAGVIAGSGFLNGTHTIKPGDDDEVSYVFDSHPVRSADVAIHAQDADTGDIAVDGADGNINIRSGRLRLSNAFGSEKRPLAMPLQAQYWSGQTWVANGDDNCTSLPASAFYFGPGGVGTSVSNAPIALAGGLGSLMLAAPNAVGSADIAINLGTGGNDSSCLSSHGGTAAKLPWLRTNGTCPPGTTVFDHDPSARATFGIYAQENRRVIHVREMF